ncbi:metallophosphoesterase [Sphingobacterium composti Ten et al. 2007 non Yoo et al. 2007]|uniref:metallophosphoesterase n=1 Tax=Sphingobacterium composti TaxID=363260 RepID=UPI001359F553|nr:metallophosphoesterase [Sphingobacterium composti Ten et al. 2007 non Yoo et al. 2007]
MIKKIGVFFLCYLVFICIAVAQSNYEKPKLSNPDSWSLVLIPDPQSYVKFSRNQGILELMTSWIRENHRSMNTKFVLCTGDLVEQNDLLNPTGMEANQNSIQQWKAVRNSFSKLDHHVPYILATGNHDYGRTSAEYRSTQYDKYFSPEQNILNGEALREIGPQLNGQSSTVNAIYEFQPTSNKKVLVMVLEFGPRQEVVDWAKKIVDSPKYTDHDVILLTHVFLDKNSSRIEKQGYKIEDVNYGEALFTKLIQPSKNIRLVFSGHIGEPDNFNGHLGFRQDKNAAGKTVTQMTFNAQAMGGGWHGNGGDGWLRYLEFMPDNKTVKVKTFSPLFAISPSTQNLAFKREANQEFTFQLD